MPSKLQHKQLQEFVRMYHEVLDALRSYDSVMELSRPKNDTAAMMACFAKTTALGKATSTLSHACAQLFGTQLVIEGHSYDDYDKVEDIIRLIKDATCGGSVSLPQTREGLGSLLSDIESILERR